jgi:hypothetical protein
LLLDIDAVTIINPYKDEAHLAIFAGKCVSLHFTYEKEKKDHLELYSYSDLRLFVKRDSRNDTEQREFCKVEQQSQIFQPVSTRYTCKQVSYHTCVSSTNETVAELVLGSFEIELDTSQDFVKKRTFSKVAWQDSCKLWRSQVGLSTNQSNLYNKNFPT